MQIIVASRNIFRRELTSYVLDEAGFSVGEATTLEGLVASLGIAAPLAIVVDPRLGGPPVATLEAIRERSLAPILWLAEPAEVQPLIGGDTCPADALPWPYHAADLHTRLAGLLSRAEPPVGRHTRAIGAAE